MAIWYLEYLQFARNNLRFLGFGTLLCFTSSAGQTYFIGIFGPEIRTEFSLSHTEWGTLYLIGTLCSAMLLPWSGQIIDKIDLRYFVATVMLGLAIACLTISSVNSVVLLTVGIFLLRQFGQGLTSLGGMTSMARYYGVHRGKAIALASMGYSIGEAILPVSAVVAISLWGWRNTYQLTAIGVLLMIPLALWLLRGQRSRHEEYLAHIESGDSENSGAISYTRRQVLQEKRFYLMTPALLMPPLISTALFFHHLTLAEDKGWSAQWVTGNYWIYAAAAIATSLIAGPIIDRFTAVRIMPLYLLPLVVSLLIIGPADTEWLLLPYMLLLGVNTGLYFTGSTAMWAELYGPKFLGAIKSLMTAMSVFSTAIGPVTVGLMLDSGLTMEAVCLWFSVACLITTLLLIRALPKPVGDVAPEQQM